MKLKQFFESLIQSLNKYMSMYKNGASKYSIIKT